jgi:type I restriction enzyme M protein
MVRERIGNRTLLLTVDEFEELHDRVKGGSLPSEIFPYLRHLLQHGKQMSFIFAGKHKIEELVGDYWSVLFNIAKYHRFGPLDRDSAKQLITEPVQTYGMVYDDLAIEEILSLTAHHPYFIQLLCDILVEECNRVQHNYVTIQDVRAAQKELVQRGSAHLEFLWREADPNGRLILATLADLQDRMDQVTTAAISDRLGSYQIRLDPGQVTQAMEQLVNRDITCPTLETGAYSFTAQLYAYWLRHYKPLSKVIEEVISERGAK